jgi:ABC-type multidrug transport system fused ATPase/permease subunit
MNLKNIFILLNPSEKKRSVKILFIILFSMILETISVGFIIPLLNTMVTKKLPESTPIWLTNFFGEYFDGDIQRILGFGFGLLIFLYILKGLMFMYATWNQSKFVFDIQERMSAELYLSYLTKPYKFHLLQNSAILVQNVVSEVSLFVNVILSYLRILTELFVIAGIALLLFYVQPVGTTFVILSFGIAGWILNRFTRNRIKLWGEQRQYHDGLRIQKIQEGYGGVKEIKLYGREQDFIHLYEYHNHRSASVLKKLNTVEPLPRTWLESIAVLELGGLFFVMSWLNTSMDAFVPILGLFASAAFRLLPSFNRCLSSFQTIRFSQSSVQVLYNEFSNRTRSLFNSSDTIVNKLPLERDIVLNNVSFKYAGAETYSVKDVSLTIKRGEIIGIIGTSGSGKSTLVDIILGLLEPEKGVVLVDGFDINEDTRNWQDNIGYVPQSIFLIDDTLRKNVAFGIADDKIDDERVSQAIEAANLNEFIANRQEGMNIFVGERGIRISGGQRQRIGIARALYHDPSVLIFDEATSALDSVTERAVMETINSLGGHRTVLIVAHRISTLDHCDRIIKMEKGEIVQSGH